MSDTQRRIEERRIELGQRRSDADAAESLRQQLTAAQSENEALRVQLTETEEKGRVLMDMCRDLRARVTRLSEALQVAVDAPELGGGEWYDMAVSALAEQAGGEK